MSKLEKNMPEQVTDKPENTLPPESAETEPQENNDRENALKQQLEAARQKADENRDLALRARAELENLRKRMQRDVENAHKYGLEKIALELLTVRDSMELGLNAARQGSDLQSLQEGVELTLKMLVQLMDKFGISEISTENQKFNPDLHQAMAAQESDKLEPNTVISVMQKGYRLNDRLLRPALVTVAKAPDKNGEDA